MIWECRNGHYSKHPTVQKYAKVMLATCFIITIFYHYHVFVYSNDIVSCVSTLPKKPMGLTAIWHRSHLAPTYAFNIPWLTFQVTMAITLMGRYSNKHGCTDGTTWLFAASQSMISQPRTWRHSRVPNVLSPCCTETWRQASRELDWYCYPWDKCAQSFVLICIFVILIVVGGFFNILT